MKTPISKPIIYHPADGESPWFDCPVCKDTRRLSALSKDMVKAMRKLRRDLRACNHCTVEKSVCPILENLNSQIQIAVQELVDEWNLS